MKRRPPSISCGFWVGVGQTSWKNIGKQSLGDIRFGSFEARWSKSINDIFFNGFFYGMLLEAGHSCHHFTFWRLVDYAKMFQYITVEEVLTPAVTKLGGQHQSVPRPGKSVVCRGQTAVDQDQGDHLLFVVKYDPQNVCKLQPSQVLRFTSRLNSFLPKWSQTGRGRHRRLRSHWTISVWGLEDHECGVRTNSNGSTTEVCNFRSRNAHYKWMVEVESFCLADASSKSQEVHFSPWLHNLG